MWKINLFWNLWFYRFCNFKRETNQKIRKTKKNDLIEKENKDFKDLSDGWLFYFDWDLDKRLTDSHGFIFPCSQNKTSEWRVGIMMLSKNKNRTVI